MNLLGRSTRTLFSRCTSRSTSDQQAKPNFETIQTKPNPETIQTKSNLETIQTKPNLEAIQTKPNLETIAELDGVSLNDVAMIIGSTSWHQDLQAARHDLSKIVPMCEGLAISRLAANNLARRCWLLFVKLDGRLSTENTKTMSHGLREAIEDVTKRFKIIRERLEEWTTLPLSELVILYREVSTGILSFIENVHSTLYVLRFIRLDEYQSSPAVSRSWTEADRKDLVERLDGLTRGLFEEKETNRLARHKSKLKSTDGWVELVNLVRETLVCATESAERKELQKKLFNLSNLGLPSYSSQGNSRPFNFSDFYRVLKPEVVSTKGAITVSALDWGRHLVKAHEFCSGSGRFADVFKGRWEGVPKSNIALPNVAIKIIRGISPDTEDGKRAIRQLKREVEVWQNLQHKNIVQFVGVSYQFGSWPALISLWMDNGTVNIYLERHPDANRLDINLGIAHGLEYLHLQEPKIVHGDIKAVNILINRNGVPCLGDFGLSRMLSGAALWVTAATNAPGSLRWQAPELVNGEQRTVTPASDVYAYAMTCIEILTGKVPFYDKYTHDGQVVLAVLVRNERPDRPYVPEMSDMLWSLCRVMWASHADDRPSMPEVVHRMGDCLFLSKPTSEREPSASAPPANLYPR